MACNNELSRAEPIRILQCVAGIARGGYETFIMNIYRNIDRKKVQFDFLYSFDGVYKDEIESLGGKLYQIPFITERGPFIYTKNVRAFFAQHPEYKIVHAHMDKFSGHILREAKLAGVPVRISHSHSIDSSGGLIYRLVKQFYGSMINPNCTDRFACSKEAGDWLFGKNSDNVIIVKNGIDLKKFSSEDKRTHDKLTITCIGRLAKEKNHTFLIDIFDEVYKINSKAQLLIAGSGDMETMLKKKVRALGLENAVSFLGDCKDVHNLLQKTDIMCLPSLFEGLGIVYIEAQACGVKCIASDRVPKEAAVSNDIQFLPLEKGANYWADIIINTDTSARNDNHKQIAECGYDIKAVSNEIQRFYIEKFNGCL